MQWDYHALNSTDLLKRHLRRNSFAYILEQPFKKSNDDQIAISGISKQSIFPALAKELYTNPSEMRKRLTCLTTLEFKDIYVVASEQDVISVIKTQFEIDKGPKLDITLPRPLFYPIQRYQPEASCKHSLNKNHKLDSDVFTSKEVSRTSRLIHETHS